MKTGRPTEYSDEVIDQICEIISKSEKGIHKICRENPDFPSVAILMRWLSDGNHRYFVEQYRRAKELQADFMAETLLEISDDSSDDTIITEKGVLENKEFVNRSKLRVETRKWLMSKLLPKKYGDKLDVTSDGKAINQSVVVPTKDTATDVNNIEG